MDVNPSKVQVLGGSNFRNALALSILSGKPFEIIDLRQTDEKCGISESQTSLLKLVDKLMNGCDIRISADGCTVNFKPGSLIGGDIKHNCGLERSIGYFLEFITWIVVILKYPLTLTLEGVTNHPADPSVDFIINSNLTIMKKFGFDNKTDIKILRRGYAPLGGGLCVFSCSPITSLSSVDLTDIGKFVKIRGVSYSMRVNTKVAYQICDYTKDLLSNVTGHLAIDVDTRKSSGSGMYLLLKIRSPGFGIILTAETTNGIVLSGEACSTPGVKEPGMIEKIAEKATQQLLCEIMNACSVDYPTHSLLLIYMAISSSSVSKVIIPYPSEYIIELLKLIKTFFGVMFKISKNDKVSEGSPETFVFSCCGSNLVNYNKHRS